MIIAYFVMLTLSNIMLHSVFSYQAKHIDVTNYFNIVLFQIKVIPLFLFVNLLTGYSYMLGKDLFGTMTMSVAMGYIVKTSTLLLITFLFFNETVSLKVFVGLVLMVIGAIVAQS